MECPKDGLLSAFSPGELEMERMKKASSCWGQGQTASLRSHLQHDCWSLGIWTRMLGKPEVRLYADCMRHPRWHLHKGPSQCPMNESNQNCKGVFPSPFHSFFFQCQNTQVSIILKWGQNIPSAKSLNYVLVFSFYLQTELKQPRKFQETSIHVTWQWSWETGPWLR